MSETALRWKGRLGSSTVKGVAVVLLILAVALLVASIPMLQTALKNDPTQPLSGEISQLVSGEVGTDRYVTVTGLANYERVYWKEEEGGKVLESYCLLVDQGGKNVVLVRSSKAGLVAGPLQLVTVTGMVRQTESELAKEVEPDLSVLRDAGAEMSAHVFIDEGRTPPSVGGSAVFVAASGLLAVLSVVPFFFPATVFAPQPPDPTAAPLPGQVGVRATGRFLRLKSPPPAVELGRGERNFESAVANIVPLPDRRLIIYIHHIMTGRVYGIKISQRESDWGVFLDPSSAPEVEPGKIYGWRDRPAARFRYSEPSGKVRTLFVSFDQAVALGAFVQQLRQMGFSVGSGLAAVS